MALLMIANSSARRLALLLPVWLPFFCTNPCAAQDQPEIPITAVVRADSLNSDLPDKQTFKASGNVRLEYAGYALEAASAQGNLVTGDISAEGPLRFASRFGTMTAERLEYNFLKGTGLLSRATVRSGAVRFDGEQLSAGERTYTVRGATATACDASRPHYRITAREIQVRPEDRAVARHASVWIGGTRLITAPRVRIGLAEETPSDIPIPKPGYGSEDGLFFSLGRDLIAGRRTYLTATLRPTTRAGIQGRADAEFLLRGGPEGRSLRPEVIEVRRDLRGLPFSLPSPQTETRTTGARGYQLLAFATASVKEKTYDLDTGRLRITRMPEVGIKWVSGSLDWRNNTAPTLSSQASLSYGRFREDPGEGYRNRLDFTAIAAAPVTGHGHSTAVRLLGIARASDYGRGQTYRALGGGMDISRRLSPRFAMSLRLITHSVSGDTPFSFDDVDIRSEAGLVLRRQTKADAQQLKLRYDLGAKTLYDWEFSISRVFHCIEPSITWRNRFNQITLDVRLVGLQPYGR